MSVVAPLEIGIACTDLEGMVAFYVSAFSLELVSKTAVPGAVSKQSILSDTGYSVARLQSPFGERVKLLCANGAARGAGRGRNPVNILQEANTVFLTFIVADIAATVQHAVTLGASAIGQVVKIRPDLSIAFLLDPEGNYLELAQYDDIGQYRPDLSARS